LKVWLQSIFFERRKSTCARMNEFCYFYGWGTGLNGKKTTKNQFVLK